MIRLFLLSFAFVTLAAFSELTLSNENADEGGSWAFAFCLFLGYCVFTGLVIIQWAFSRDEDKIKQFSRFNEFFRGCKQGVLERSWGFYWMLRVLLFVVLACSIETGGRFWSLSLLFIAQIFYVAIVAVLRPFEEWVDYVVELFNNVMLAIHLFILYFQDKRSRWNEGVDSMWLSFIVITVAINAIVITG